MRIVQQNDVLSQCVFVLLSFYDNAFDKRTIAYFIRGSITVRLTSCLTGFDLTKLVNVNLIQHAAKQLNPNQSNGRSAVQ